MRSLDDHPEKAPFWQAKPLDKLNAEEWEALCDGCARCCLIKLEDIDTGQLAWTDVACRLLDRDACTCSDYENRSKRVSDCVQLTPDNIPELGWLPLTCAYRLLAEGRDLYWWHPLVSGDPETVHLAGVSARGRVLSEDDVDEADLENRIVAWPITDPWREDNSD